MLLEILLPSRTVVSFLVISIFHPQNEIKFNVLLKGQGHEIKIVWKLYGKIGLN